MFIIYSHPSKPFQPIIEWQYDDLSQRSQPMQNETTQNEDDYLQNPFPENEIVAVDEEVMYVHNELVNALTVAMHAEKEKDKDFDDEEEHEDDEGSDCEVENWDDVDDLAGNDHNFLRNIGL
ncbi:unnamed protein product [Urochloa humidicola]